MDIEAVTIKTIAMMIGGLGSGSILGAGIMALAHDQPTSSMALIGGALISISIILLLRVSSP